MASSAAQRLATGAIMVLAGGVVVAAVASGLGGGKAAPPTTHPRTTARAPVASPAPGDALRSLPAPPARALAGTLDLVSDGCAIERLDLATGTLATVQDEARCRVWFSPSGDYAIASVPLLTNLTVPLVRLRVTGRGSAQTTAVVAATRNGPPAIADDGTASSCTARGLVVDSGPQALRRRRLCAATALGRRIVAFDAARRRIIDARTARTLFALPAGTVTASTMLVAGTAGRTLGIVTPGRGSLRLTRVDTASGTVSAPIAISARGGLERLAISDDGRLFGVMTAAGWAVWNVGRPAPLHSIGDVPIDDVAFSPDSRSIAIATQAGLAIVDAATFAPRYAVPVLAFRVAWHGAQ